MCLQDARKGWFNLKEKDWPIYELSKLSRYMELVKFRMQTAIKYLVESSTDVLVKIVETPCQVCLDIPDEGFEWGPDLINTPFKPVSGTVFSVSVKMSQTETIFSTGPMAFEASIKNYIPVCSPKSGFKRINSSYLEKNYTIKYNKKQWC